MKSKSILGAFIIGYSIFAWVLYTDPLNKYHGSIYLSIGVLFICFYLMVTNTHPKFFDRFDNLYSKLKRYIPGKTVQRFNKLKYGLSLISPYALAFYLGWQAHAFWILPAESIVDKLIMVDDQHFIALLLTVVVLSSNKEGTT